MKIRIIATPPGQAPEWIRREWVGLEFESKGRQQSLLSKLATAGALGGKPENLGGYAVNSVEAVHALEQKNPTAAEWFKDNSNVREENDFIFRADVCEEI